MILNNRQISEAVSKGDIFIEPFDENQVQAATYDLKVGAQGATASAKKLINIHDDGYLLLKPGDFAIITVLEELHLSPQYVGRFGIRSKYARKGIIATTGPQIDPGYEGRLIIGLTNPTPNSVTLPYKDDFLSVEFHKLEEPSTKPYSGPYQGKKELGPEDIEMIVETESLSMSEILTTLNILSKNVGSLATDVKILTSDIKSVKWKVGIGISILSIIVAIISVVVAFGSFLR